MAINDLPMSAKARKKFLDGDILETCQLITSSHPFLYELWKSSCHNNWMPSEISLHNDAKQWKERGFLSEDERLIVKRVLGFFSSGESLVSSSIPLVEYRYITDGAARQYLSRKQFEESLHNSTIEVCCEALSLDVGEVADAYKNIKAIREKDAFVTKVTKDIINDREFDIKSTKGKQDLLKNLFMYYVIMEGLWFYPNFAMIFALGRQNKMVGISDQIRYTLRDESNHLKAGVYFINTIKADYPECWTKKFQEELVSTMKSAVQLEIEYAKETLPNGILGLNEQMFSDYCMFIGNRRLESIGLDFRFDSDRNPFPWLSEAADIGAMGAFFERRERNYQQAGAVQDDF